MLTPTESATDGQIAYYEDLYSGFCQEHFAKQAVRAFRKHLAERIVRATSASPASRVFSLGCGIGDTEILLAPRVGRMTGIDTSPAAIRQARRDAASADLQNTEFLAGDLYTHGFAEGAFDIVIAVFFLHHLPDEELDQLAGRVRWLLAPGGVFYSLDPSRYRLSGAIGKVLVPGLMRKYQAPGERELAPSRLEALFRAHGFQAQCGIYDFLSTPLAGLLPSARWIYQLARLADEALVRAPLVRHLGSNFELLARR